MRFLKEAALILASLLSIALAQAAQAEEGTPGPSPEISSRTIRTVEITGNKAFKSSELMKHLTVQPGQPFDENQFVFSHGSLESFYRDQGYFEVTVATETVKLPNKEIDCRFKIEEGEIYHVNSVRVTGLKLIQESVIKREMKIEPGDPFSQNRIYEATKSLFLSGYFETIDISYSSATAHTMDIVAKIKERPTKYIKGGFGYGAETKERLSLGYEDKNFFGHTRKLDLSGVVSGFTRQPDKYQTTILQGSLAQPHLFDSEYDGKTSLSQEWDKRESYYSANAKWQTAVGRRFGKSITANLQYRYEGVHTTHLSPDEINDTPAFTNISAIGPNVTYDNTNDPFLPFYGWRVTSLFEKGFNWVLGDLNFYKFTARVGRFETYFKETTFFSGLQFGVERPTDPAQPMPIFERFYLGGANSVRGYEERQLGPKDSEGAPTGGEAFGVVNLELRHRLYKKLFGVMFLDGGQLWERGDGQAWPDVNVQKLNDLAYGTGFGIRFHTPVGAIRLELGYQLNPPGEGSPAFFHRTAVHFSLGEVF